VSRSLTTSVRSAPATLVYLLALAATTAMLNLASARTDDRLLLALSTNLHQLARVPVRVLVASAFWVGGWSSFLLWAALLATVLAPLERRLGWRRTTFVFALGHVGATLLVAAGLWVALSIGAVDPDVAGARDVGASYGFLAAAAVAALLLPPRLRLFAATTLAASVAVAVGLSHTFTDFGHLLAVAIGFACAPRIGRSAPGKQRGAGDDERERREARVSSRAARQALVEERDPGCDRECVREEGREAGRRQRSTALEGKLEHDERESVRGRYRGREGSPAAPA